MKSFSLACLASVAHSMTVGNVVKIPEYGDVPNGVFVGTFWNNHLELDDDIGKFAGRLLR